MIHHKQNQKGYIMLLNTVLFIAIILVVIIGVANPILSHYSSVRAMVSSRQSFLTAQSAAEEAIYRLKTGKSMPSSLTVTLASGSATVTKSTSNGATSIAVASSQNSYQKNMQVDVTIGAGIDFNYGLQSGNGGMNLGGGSTINGNLYSNGSIVGNSVTVNGSAIAANSASLTADQVNNTPTTPPSSITFRNAAASQDFAQSFQISADAPLNKVLFYIKKAGAPTDATVNLVADKNGAPDTTALDSQTLSSGGVTTSYGWVTVQFTHYYALVASTTYWLVIQNSAQSSSAYYVVGSNTGVYSNGIADTGKTGGTWTSTGMDSYFQVYTGGVASYIGGGTYLGAIAVNGDAWASSVTYATVTGHMYCNTTVQTNKSCDVTHGLPPPQSLPFTDGNIQDWETSATAGGTLSGDQTIGWQGGTLGPKKITGNLTVNGGGTLTLTGPLYVTGNVLITSGGKVALPSNYGKNSETIVADGTITVSGGGSVGSGDSSSFLFFVSNSTCPVGPTCSGNSAINITGGAGAIAANAQNGNVSLSGGAVIDAVVGNSVSVTGGSTVNYNTGLASPSFTSGPSGGYNLVDWVEN